MCGFEGYITSIFPMARGGSGKWKKRKCYQQMATTIENTHIYICLVKTLATHIENENKYTCHSETY